MSKKEASQPTRRQFFKFAGIGAGALGAAAAASSRPAKAAVGSDGSTKGRYRETRHVKNYYDTAKF